MSHSQYLIHLGSILDFLAGRLCLKIQQLLFGPKCWCNYLLQMTIFWTWGFQISPKTTEVQLVSEAAFVCKEGWTINHLNMKFISQMI